MGNPVWSLVTGLALAASALAGPPADGQPGQPKPAKPAVFSDKSYADGLAATKGTSKILIVKGTAAWCAPCKLMDRTTFLDENVIKWFGENGLIIDLDVDHHRETAQSLNIRAMPTMIAFKNGEEVDRILGYKDGPNFLAWLNDVKAGKRSGEDLEIKVDKAAKGEGQATARERYENFQALLNSGRDLEKATDEAVWLWNNLAKEEPSMLGVRSSFFAGSIERLIDAHPAAADRFRPIRDEAWNTYKANPKKLESLSDWTVLNDVLGEPEKTLEWFDTVKADPANANALRRVSFRLERLLIEHDRVADICLIYPDPIAKLRRDDDMRKMLPKLTDAEQDRMVRESQDRNFRDGAGKLYASLLMAKRSEDAAALLAEAIKLDDTGAMRVALARAAIENKAGHKGLYPLLDEAQKSGEAVEGLRADLDKQAANP